MVKFKVGDKVKYSESYYEQKWFNECRTLVGIVIDIDYSNSFPIEVEWSDGIVNHRKNEYLILLTPDLNEAKLRKALGL